MYRSFAVTADFKGILASKLATSKRFEPAVCQRLSHSSNLEACSHLASIRRMICANASSVSRYVPLLGGADSAMLSGEKMVSPVSAAVIIPATMKCSSNSETKTPSARAHSRELAATVSNSDIKFTFRTLRTMRLPTTSAFWECSRDSPGAHYATTDL